MSPMFFLRRGSTSPIYKPSNFAIFRFLRMSRYKKNNNHVISASANAPLSGSLVLPCQYTVTELPYKQPPESNDLKVKWIHEFYRDEILAMEEMEEHDAHAYHLLTYEPRDELYHKYYADWKQYILQSKSDNGDLSLPLSKILLRTLHEYMDDSPNNKVYRPSDNFEPSIDGPIAVLDGCRYFSLKNQNVSFFHRFHTPPTAHRSSWRHWLIIHYDKREERQEKYQPFRGMTCRFCLWTRRGAYVPQPDSINCHMSSPFLARIKKMRKDGSGLLLRRFAITSPSSPPWASIIMAIDKRRGYLVYSGAVQDELSDHWVVLDSKTKYSTGDLLYFNKDGNFYVLPDAQSGHLEVWSFQNRLLSKTKDINAELFHNDNSYHHIHSYLVESLNGNLLLVRRYVVESDDYYRSFKTRSFEVFDLKFCSECWEVVSSLGKDEALFVGSNTSFALSSTKYREVIPNCIYFTDQLCDCGHGEKETIHGNDNGIFHLQDCTVTTLFSNEECDHAPTWLCPSGEWWPQHYRSPMHLGGLGEYGRHH